VTVVDTSRPVGDGEVDSREYHFVSKHAFEADVAVGRFVEYGEYEKQLFGTSMEAIRQVVNSGKICVLNFHPQVHTVSYSFEGVIVPCCCISTCVVCACHCGSSIVCSN